MGAERMPMRLLVCLFLGAAGLLVALSVSLTQLGFQGKQKCPPCECDAHQVAATSRATEKPEKCPVCPSPLLVAASVSTTKSPPGAYVPKGNRPLVIPDDICIYVVIPFVRGIWTPNYDKSFHDFSEDMMMGLRPAVKAGAELLAHSIDNQTVNMSARFKKMLGGTDETVVDKVKRRLKSPKATNTTCRWIVQARVDADDYLGELFVPTLLNLMKHEIAAHDTFKAAIVHQRRLTRVYMFPLPNNTFSCKLWKHRTSGVGPQVSTGFTLIMRRDIWDAAGKPSVLDGTFSAVFHHAQAKYGDDFSNLYFPPDGVTMSPVTQLSSHFPWFDHGPYPPCDFEEIEEYFGASAAVHLSVARVPRVSILDACVSNKYVLGILRRNTGKGNFECQDFQKFWTKNLAQERPMKTQWPG